MVNALFPKKFRTHATQLLSLRKERPNSYMKKWRKWKGGRLQNGVVTTEGVMVVNNLLRLRCRRGGDGFG